MKSTHSPACLRAGFALATVFLCSLRGADGPAASHPTGSLSGRVQNLATGAYLEGSTVTLDRGQHSTLTSRGGSFYFTDLPAGEYRLAVSYTGLDPQTIAVVVAPGQAVVREIGLTSQAYAMEAFTVAGEREGNALAITQQRNAPNIKNVISADAFGNIADQNIGEVLARLPGMSEEILEGQIVSISVRGVSADFNSITLDGTRGASSASVAPGGSGALTRGYALDRIPADFVDRIEVTKSATPDMDGDSIGGAVNLRTKSPLDHKGRLISYSAGTSWNLDRDTFRPIGSFFYSDTFGPEQKVGVLFTTSYNKTDKPRDSIYQNWQQTAATNVPVYFWMTNIGEEQLEHERFGAGLRFDYKLSRDHRVFVNTLYSDYDDTFGRRHMTMGAPTAAQVRPGWTERVTETINHPVTLAQLHRRRSVDGINVVFGGEKRTGRGLIDYGANYSRSESAIRSIVPSVQVQGVGFRFERIDPLNPLVTQISGPAIADRTDHRITALNFQKYDDLDEIRGAHFNWKHRFSDQPVASIKTGLRYRGEERSRRQEAPQYTYMGRDGVVGRNPATGINDDNVAQFADLNYKYGASRGRYAPVPAMNPDLLVQYWRANPALFPENIVNTTRNALQFNGTVKEEVSAAYVMGDVRFGRLDITTGVRVEQTEITGHGVRQEITPAERARRAAWVGVVTPEETRRRTIAEWSNRREDEGKYRSILPSVHLKYNLTASLIARASYGTGIGRPNFSNLLRTTTVDYENLRVVAANPDLRPQTADNFDVSLEYYFEPAGYLSAGAFVKELKDFIYGDRGGVVPAGPNNGFEGEYEGFELIRNINGGSGRVRGFELAYNQRFSRFPGLWKGLGVMANYTRLESRGNYTSSGGTQTGGQIAGFMPETFNASISYTLRGWDLQVKYSHRAQNLRDYSANPLLQVYYYSKKNVDLNLKYRWHPRLTLFADVINIFDDPIANAFIYTPARTRFNQVFTPAIKAGISGRF